MPSYSSEKKRSRQKAMQTKKQAISDKKILNKAIGLNPRQLTRSRT